ncbi:hypothetical protein [Salinibacter altiplanensis]|uniref:hypothetical protein n=1 Tax=Salinibacter altiplanensis TaxID=1803181 RepID=UPI000C9F852E|nr:hypothetical protein [Salinibacter altiplanensis]
MINFVRMSALRWLTVPLIFCVMALSITACDSSGISVKEKTPQQPTTQAYSGKTIFKGLFFAEGPVAKKYPEIWKNPSVTQQLSKMTTEQQAEAEELETKILNWIGEERPQFFGEFRQAIQSGDHLQIRKALDRSSTLTLNAIEDITGINPEKAVANPAKSAGEGTCAVVVFAAVAAVVVALAFYVAEISKSTDSSLRVEEFVDEIAARLHRPAA